MEEIRKVVTKLLLESVVYIYIYNYINCFCPKKLVAAGGGGLGQDALPVTSRDSKHIFSFISPLQKKLQCP